MLVSFVGSACVFLAVFLFIREVVSVRNQTADCDQLFVYTNSRIALRAFGLLALLALGVTLILFSAYPPKQASLAKIYIGAFSVELVTLLFVAVFDLRETRRIVNTQHLNDARKANANQVAMNPNAD